MKIRVKKLLSVALVALICLSLCSCAKLDEMKEQQAFYLNPEKTEISWQGVTYKYLPIQKDADIMSAKYQHAGFVTDQDVPVLMSQYMGSAFYLVAPYELINTEQNRFYCKEQDYDKYLAMVENYTLNKYAYRYDKYADGYNYEEVSEFVEPKTEEAIVDIIANYNIKGAMMYNFEWRYSIIRCDENKMFYADYIDVLEVEGVGYFLEISNKYNESSFYKVPDEYKEYFKEIYLKIIAEKTIPYGYDTYSY